MSELEQVLRQKFDEFVMKFFNEKGKEPDWQKIAFKTFVEFVRVCDENERLITTIETIKAKG